MERYKVSVETVLGENEDIDKGFFDYLEEYSIDYVIEEKEIDRQWPIVEYRGGMISLTNMLKERFGMEDEEIKNRISLINS